jgi:hypothetical protein
MSNTVTVGYLVLILVIGQPVNLTHILGFSNYKLPGKGRMVQMDVEHRTSNVEIAAFNPILLKIEVLERPPVVDVRRWAFDG